MPEPQIDVEALAQEHLQIFRATIPNTPRHFDFDTVRAEASGFVPPTGLLDPVLRSPGALDLSLLIQNMGFRIVDADDVEGFRVDFRDGPPLHFRDLGEFFEYLEVVAESQRTFQQHRRQPPPVDEPSIPGREVLDSDATIYSTHPDCVPILRQRSMSMSTSENLMPPLSPQGGTASAGSREEDTATPEPITSGMDQPRIAGENESEGTHDPESSEDLGEQQGVETVQSRQDQEVVG